MNHLKIILAGTGGLMLAGLLLACTGSGPSLGDEQISLRSENLMTTTSAPGPVFSSRDPGENKPYPRAYFGAPPMIPHSLTDMEISAKANDCVDCHEEGDKDTPGLPPSHRIKPRIEILGRNNAHNGQLSRVAGFGRVETVSGNRYSCMLCHAPQAGNVSDLVDNTFTSQKPSDARQDSLDNLKPLGKF